MVTATNDPHRQTTPGTAESPPANTLTDNERTVDPRVTLWARVTTRVPGALRKFRRLDRRARAGVFSVSEGLAAAMLTSNVWGRPGGRAASNEAMRVTQRSPQRRRTPREHRALPSWFMVFGVASNDGGRSARRFIENPQRAASNELKATARTAARPKVVARLLRILPAEMRHPARWPWLPFLANELGAAETTLLLRRALADGLGAADIERGIERALVRAWRRHGVRARHGAELSDAQVDVIIEREWPTGGAA